MPNRKKPAKVMAPQASRTIEGLRDTGYEPDTALTDIVDNSIAAGATKISIDFFADPLGQVKLYVSDNGEGMSEDKLDDAMTYGSQVREDKSSLGKFGLGMKTASTSMARCLTVVTRDTANSAPYTAQWDLDHVVDVNEWELQYPDEDEVVEEMDRLDLMSPNGSGTVISWTKIDRLLSRDYKNPAAKSRDIARKEKVFRDALELTYHKFLDPYYTTNPLEILLNGESIRPWDPYGRDISDHVIDKDVPITVVHENGEKESLGEIFVKGYILPPGPELSKEQASALVVGIPPAGLGHRQGTPTSRQGIYVYRENRLIAFNTWLGAYDIEPHYNLMRVDFSFDHRQDEIFALDIKKSQIKIEADLVDYLTKLFSPFRTETNNRSRRNERKTAKIEGGSLHETSNKIIEPHKNSASPSVSIRPVEGQKNSAKITNNQGTSILIGVGIHDEPNEPHVVPTDDMSDPNVLWEPAINLATGNKQAVALYVGHEFYRRVYGNLEKGELGVQGLDTLLWALMQAELEAHSEEQGRLMKGIRFRVSTILQELSVHQFGEPKNSP